MNKIIVLIGAPGAGKGTQAKLLQERQGLPQISTGDIFRGLAKSDTPLAKQIKEIQAAGQLVNDDLVVRVVEERTLQDDCGAGYVLDGFPRTIVQAEKLEDLAKSQNKELRAILIDVSFEVLEKRITGRRNCPVDGEIYNVYFQPPMQENICDQHPEIQLVQREDDREDNVRARLEVYQRETQPLIDYYEKSGRLQRVDGLREPETVYQALERIVSN